MADPQANPLVRQFEHLPDGKAGSPQSFKSCYAASFTRFSAAERRSPSAA